MSAKNNSHHHHHRQDMSKVYVVLQEENCGQFVTTTLIGVFMTERSAAQKAEEIAENCENLLSYKRVEPSAQDKQKGMVTCFRTECRNPYGSFYWKYIGVYEKELEF